MTRDEVASEELRELVAGFQVNGLPEITPTEEVLKTIPDDQRAIIQEIVKLSEQERKDCSGKLPEEGSKGYGIRTSIRSKLQEALMAGMANIGIIQRHAPNYGAMPLPECEVPDKNWRWFFLPDGSYACWECGSRIMQKTISNSVWISDGPGPCSGDGEVQSATVPYCPLCDPEPQNGVVMKTTDEAIAELCEGVIPKSG